MVMDRRVIGLLKVQFCSCESRDRREFRTYHRSNLLGMGVLPLEFMDGQGWKALGLDGTEPSTSKAFQTYPHAEPSV